MILQTKLLIGAAALFVVTAWAVVRPQDANIVWKALAERREAELAAHDKTIESLKKGISLIDSSAAISRLRYVVKTNKLNDSLDILDKQLAALLASAPDSMKPLVREIATTCKSEMALLRDHVTECEKLLDQDSARIARRDSIIFNLSESRDSWKKMYTDKPTTTGQPMWLVALEMTTAFIAGIGSHLLIK